MRTDLPLTEQLKSVVSSVISEAGPVHVVAIGSTGFSGSEDLDGLRTLAQLGVRGVLLAHDSVTSYLGALGNEQGAVVAAGTGVVTLAVGADAVARVDGWGHIMGDAGSGYWFGRAALDAALRAYDGRGRKTALLDRVKEEFGEVEGAYLALQADPSRVRRTATFAKWVTTAADDGDDVAADICQRGSAELALSVASGLGRVGISSSAASSICTLGGLFRSPSITQIFTKEIKRLRPNILTVAALGDSLDGAIRLLTLPPRSPLAGHVTHIDFGETW